MPHYVVSPSEETDFLRFMHRWDLYQWADKKGIEYPKDAPAVVMKTLVRANGALPQPEDFNPLYNERGEVYSFKYKRLSPLEAPRSRHADADDAETKRVLAKRRKELEAMNERQLTRAVKDQFGAKMLERDLSRADMIALFVGEAEEAAPIERGGIYDPFDQPLEAEGETQSEETIPENVLAMLTPMQLVKLCKQKGLKANIKEGKVALLEKLKAA